jgi:hypothetical protein
MPFKSQAQRRKFAELLVKGEISPDTFEEWNRETGGKKLPERVTPGTARRAKRKTAKKRVAKKRVAKKKVAKKKATKAKRATKRQR